MRIQFLPNKTANFAFDAIDLIRTKMISANYTLLIIFIIVSVMNNLLSAPPVFAWQAGSKPNNFIDYTHKKKFLTKPTASFNANTRSTVSKRWSQWTSNTPSGCCHTDNLCCTRTHWRTKDETRQLCQRKGRTSNECHNYIRVFIKSTPGRDGGDGGQEYQICGTNAFEPQCRTYMKNGAGEFIPQIGSEIGGVGVVAYDPQYNSSHVYAGGELYSALAVDAMSMKPAVVRGMLRTSRNNPFHEPNFAGGFADESFVYFGLRETAIEHINCGKRVVARLARVCRNDHGPRTATNGRISTWTSFSKARLNCSVPGDYPFYFDELHGLATVGPVSEQYDGGNGRVRRVLYGVFTTPDNSITGSAVCAYDMEEVERVFAGRFKEQRDMNSNWLAVNEDRVVAGVRAATQCTVNDSRSNLSDAAVRFVETHPLMDEAVPALYGRPVLVATLSGLSGGNGYEPMRFRAIDVLPQVAAVDDGREQRRYDVIYVGTSDGRLVKVVNLLATRNGESASQESAIVEEQQVLSRRAPITSVQVVNDRVIVVSNDELLSLPLQHCAESSTCGSCVARQDPHCAWHVKMRKCVHYQANVAAAVDVVQSSIWIQNVRTGKHADICLKTAPDYGLDAKAATGDDDSGLSINRFKKRKNQFVAQTDAAADDPADPSNNIGIDAPLRESRRLELLTIVRNQQQQYSDVSLSVVPEWKASQVLAISSNVYREETLAMAVVLTLVLSLTVGFIVGYQMSRWRRCSAADRLKDATNMSVDSNSSSTADYAQFPLSNSQVDSSSPPAVNGFNTGSTPLPYRLNNKDLTASHQTNDTNNMAVMLMMMRDSVASSTATASTTSAGSGTQKRPPPPPVAHAHGLTPAVAQQQQQRQMLLRHHQSFNAHYHHPPAPPLPPLPSQLNRQLHYNPYAIESLLPTTNMGKPLSLVTNVNSCGTTIMRHASCVGYPQPQQQHQCRHPQQYPKSHNKLFNGAGSNNFPATATLPRLKGGTLNRNLNALNTSKAYL